MGYGLLYGGFDFRIDQERSYLYLKRSCSSKSTQYRSLLGLNKDSSYLLLDDLRFLSHLFLRLHVNLPSPIWPTWVLVDASSYRLRRIVGPPFFTISLLRDTTSTVICRLGDYSRLVFSYFSEAVKALGGSSSPGFFPFKFLGLILDPFLGSVFSRYPFYRV